MFFDLLLENKKSVEKQEIEKEAEKVDPNEITIFIKELNSFCKPTNSKPTVLMKVKPPQGKKDLSAYQKFISGMLNTIGFFRRSFVLCLSVLWTRIKKLPGIGKLIEKIASAIGSLPLFVKLKRFAQKVWNTMVPIGGGMRLRLGEIINNAIIGLAISLVGLAILKKAREKGLIETVNLDHGKVNLVNEIKVVFENYKHLNGKIDYTLLEAVLPIKRRRGDADPFEDKSFLERVADFVKESIESFKEETKKMIGKILSVIFLGSIVLIIGWVLKLAVCKLTDKDSKIRLLVNNLSNAILSHLKMDYYREKGEMFDICSAFSKEVVADQTSVNEPSNQSVTDQKNNTVQKNENEK